MNGMQFGSEDPSALGWGGWTPDMIGSMSAWGQPQTPGPNLVGGVDISSLSPLDRLQAQNMQRTWDFQDRIAANQASANQPMGKFAAGSQMFGQISQGLYGLGSIYLGLDSLRQQKKEFNFNKGVINTNLNNAITDYNRRLGDTLANRALNNGAGQGWVSEQLAKYSAKRS